MTYTSALHLGNTHQEIVKLLDFYQKEIDFLEKMLAEVVNKNTAQEALAQAEHFQNQFLIQKRNIDEYRNRIVHNAQLSSIDSQEHAGKVDERLVLDAESMVKEVQTFEQIMNELRTEFKQFLVKWM